VDALEERSVSEIERCDVLIVASPEDSLAREFARSCGQHGYRAGIFDLETTARLFTITVDYGAVVVKPQKPVLLRIPPPPAIRGSFDEAFLSGECFATLFAAVALSKAQVINPVHKGSLNGRLTDSSALTSLRIAAPVEQEVFASSLPGPPSEDPTRSWCVQDLSTFRTTTWPLSPEGSGPFRAKWADAHPAYEMVVVLDTKAWRTSRVDLRPLDLELRTVDLAAQLGLRFAVVTWAISASLDSACVVRVDPYPAFGQVRPVWPEVQNALVKAFLT
jgi:hypothetical protein